MRTAMILLLWQCLVAKDKLCGRATVLRSTVGYNAWQKFGTKSKKHTAYMKCEIRNLLQTTQCIEWRNQQTIITAMVYCPRFQQFFGILPPRKMKITIIVMNIIWRFCHICLRSCSIKPFHPNQIY